MISSALLLLLDPLPIPILNNSRSIVDPLRVFLSLLFTVFSELRH